MRFQPECYPCAMRQTLAAARLATPDADLHYLCMRRAAATLSSADPGITPPEMGEGIYRLVRELTGNEDPFRSQKLEQNRSVAALLPWLRETVAGAGDSLLTAARLAVAGNAVDPGAQEDFKLEESVRAALEGGYGWEDYPSFRERLSSSAKVLFIADNCGEVVFDRVLIETITAETCAEVTLAVRGGPIINDVTITEALELGLVEICRVISSGMEMPGTVVERATAEFRREFELADMVISKGQGNWETLEGSPREVFFLLQAKCPVVARANGVEVGTLLLARSGT